MFRLLLKFVILLNILGCGTMLDKKASSGSSNKLSLPKEISIEIPKILREDEKIKKLKKENANQNTSKGYQSLQTSIEELVWSQKLANVNLLFAQRIISEVDHKCKKEKLNTACIISEGELSFVFDDKFISDMGKIAERSLEEDFKEIKNKIIPLGQVIFTRYDIKEKYQYNLKIDATPISILLGEDIVLSIQTLQWSKDKKHVLTILEDESPSEKEMLSIYYQRKKSGEKEMDIKSHYQHQNTINRETFDLNIIDKNDENETFKISSNYQDLLESKGELYQSHSQSIGEISTQGGFLKIEGSYFDYKTFKEKYLFDGEGEIISSQYCEENLVCDMNDVSTWLDIAHIESDNNVKLHGTVGGLQHNTRYLIFSPEVEIEDNSLLTSKNQERILLAVVGQIYIFENQFYGELFSDRYANRLDELVIARSIKEGEKYRIEVIDDENRPSLEIAEQ